MKWLIVIILGVIAAIMVLYISYDNMLFPDDWEDIWTDDDGDIIGSFKQELKMQYVDGTTEIIDAGFTEPLYLYRNGKLITAIYYIVRAEMNPDVGDEVWIRMNNYQFTVTLKYEGTEVYTRTFQAERNDDKYPIDGQLHKIYQKMLTPWELTGDPSAAEGYALYINPGGSIGYNIDPSYDDLLNDVGWETGSLPSEIACIIQIAY